MFDINLSNAKKIATFSFGVYHGTVQTPDFHRCVCGDKPFSRFFYIIKGTMVFDKGTEKELRVPSGNMIYLPNDITYNSQWLPGDDGEYISVNFRLDEIYVSLPNKICVVAKDDNGYYIHLLLEMLDAWNKGAIGYKIKTLSSIYNLMYCIENDNMRIKTKEKHRTIYKGIIYLENNYINDVSVKDLSDMCNTSESNFRRLFKKYKNMSPITYRNYLRIKKSCELLRSGECSIAEAAAAVGINDLCYYYKLYAKFMNGTPKELAATSLQ